MPVIKQFKRNVRQRLLIWQLGLIMALVLLVSGIAASALIIYMLADLFLALPARIRASINILIPATLSVIILWRLLKTCTIPARQAAKRLDHVAEDSRNSVLSAFELTGRKARRDAGQSMLQFLINKSCQSAINSIRSISFIRWFPFRGIGKSAMPLLISLVAAGVIYVINADALNTSLNRIIDPSLDIPPYSRFSFEIQPHPISVAYGDNVDISVNINGAEVSGQVWFQTRYQGRITRRACFRDKDSTFVQRLENVVQPIEICFVTGRARSHWQSVELMLKPRISDADISISPPAYCGRPSRGFKAGEAPLRALHGAQVQLKIIANRVLSGGELKITPDDGPGSYIQAEIIDRHSASFKWSLTENASLSITVKDPRGITNEEPLELRQTLEDDLI